jgi:general nucleoside transport system permease protein
MLDNLTDIDFLLRLFESTIRLAMPIAFAALGGVFAERSGVFNIGLEGLMLMGAFGAALGTFYTGSPVLGLITAMLLGMLLALPLAVMAVTLGVNQIVAGIAINLFALGMTSFMARIVIGATASTQLLPGFRPVAIPVLSSIPFVGPVLFNQDVLVYLMYALVPLFYVLLFHTPWGLNVRAVGHNPRACDTAGVSVVKVRYFCVLLSGLLASLGGAYLVLSQVFVFSENMSAGKGFIALAAVILGRWSPVGAILACLLFGFFDALQLRLQFENPEVPYQIFSTLPYVVSILALIVIAGRNVSPQAIGRHYDRESH